MTTISRRPKTSTRSISGSSAPIRGSHPYPSCLLPARSQRSDKPHQLPLTWEDLLGRR